MMLICHKELPTTHKEANQLKMTKKSTRGANCICGANCEEKAVELTKNLPKFEVIYQVSCVFKKKKVKTK